MKTLEFDPVRDRVRLVLSQPNWKQNFDECGTAIKTLRLTEYKLKTAKIGARANPKIEIRGNLFVFTTERVKHVCTSCQCSSN